MTRKHADFHILFWGAANNRQALVDGIGAYKGLRQLSTSALVDELKGNWVSDEILLEDGALKRFANCKTQKPHNKRGMTDLYLTLCNLVDEHAKGAPQDASFEGSATFLELRARFDSRSSNSHAGEREADDRPEKPTTRSERSAPSPVKPAIQKPHGLSGSTEPMLSDEQWEAFFDALAPLLETERRQIFDACKTFFSQEEIDSVTGRSGTFFNRHYYLYRPLSLNDSIVKSFVEIRLDGFEFGHACYFTNYYRHGRPQSANGGAEAFTRVSKGIVVPTRPVLYLIGEIHGGSGLKIVALSDTHHPAPSYKGLLLSFEEINQPIAARCILQRTEDNELHGAKIGIFRAEDVRAELGDHYDYLRERSGATLTAF